MKIIWLDHQNNYVECSSIMNNTVKNFDISVINLNVLHNYFDSPMKLFSDLRPAKFLTKPFFPYTIQFFEWIRKFLFVMSDVGTGWKLILAPLQFILPWASNMPWKLHARKNKFWICQWIGGFCYSLQMVNGLSAKWFNDCDWDRFQFSILQLITLYRVRKCKFLDNTTDNVITRSATELFWQIINK